MGINYKSSWTDIRDEVPNDARWVIALASRGYRGVVQLIKEYPTLVWRGKTRRSYFPDTTHWMDIPIEGLTILPNGLIQTPSLPVCYKPAGSQSFELIKKAA